MDFKKAFDFLRKLSKNNNREWFEKHKPDYLLVKDDFENFVGEVLKDAIGIDERLASLEPKKLTFRIYRDIRFSKDKTPYKTFLSAAISRAGKDTHIAGYYFQIEPGNKSMLATGLYLPEAESLSKIRQEIDYNGDRLDAIVKEKKFNKQFGDLWQGDKLKTMPKGYPKDHPHIEYLKLRSILAMTTFNDADVNTGNFAKTLVNAMKTSKPLIDFLYQALD